MARSYLVLEDGSVYEGEPFGYRSSAYGEVVFSTGMSGYQESMTDPSVRGQILVESYPLIGNYGINDEFSQSNSVHIRALVCREYCREPSESYGERTLDDFMKKYMVPGISGIDTRDLVIKLRETGTMKGAITENPEEIDDVIKKLKKMPYPSESNLVAEVSCKKTEKFGSGKEITVGLLDCGTKTAILKELTSRFNVIMFPYDTHADAIIASKVQGLVVSSGPGNPTQPEIMKTVVKTISDLSGKMPMFGISFGHQAICVALGAKLYKMKFGHHGSQPVKFEDRVYITSQGHDYAVDAESLKKTGLVADQFNVNDGTVAGVKHKTLPIFSVQYHPEAAPGPRETMFLFDRFGKMIKEGRQ